MSRFLFASIPITAHTSNPLPIAARLTARGHDVLWYAGKAFRGAIEATGATHVPYEHAADFSAAADVTEVFPQLRGEGPKVISRAFADVFIGQAGDRMRDLRPLMDGVDATLSDGLMFGVGFLSELTGVPWATFGDGPLGFAEPDTPPFGPGLLPMRGPVGRLRNRVVNAAARRLLFAEPQRVYERIRTEHGLPVTGAFALDDVFSPFLHLQVSTPSFEYPRRNLPGHVHWIGALRPDPVEGWRPPSWWPEVTGSARPVVHVSQGSLRPDATELVVPALRALADEDVLVVVTSGAASAADVERAYGGPLPANVRVTPFVPYDVLLPHVAVFVTNGGWSGLTVALHHGVPIVQAGTTEEKSENGARVQWSGVGLRLGTTRPTAEQVGRAVRRVLREPGFAAAAARVQAEMVRHDGPNEAADLLERLARTRRPVEGPVYAM